MHRLRTFVLTILFMLLSGIMHSQELEKIDSLMLEIQLSEDPVKKADLLLMLSDNYKDNDPALALVYAEESYSLATEIEYMDGIVHSLSRQADYHRGLTNFERAMELAVTSLNFAKEAGLDVFAAEASYVIGSVYNDLGNYDLGSDYYFNSLKLYEKAEDQAGIAKSLNGIGAIYFEQKNYDKALEYFFDALKLSEKINDRDGIARGLNNVAVVFQDNDEHQQANRYFMQAIEVNQELNYKRGEAINFLNMGISMQELSSFDTALMYFKHSLGILQELNYNFLVATNQIYLGKFWLQIGKVDTALYHLTKAHEIGKELNSHKLVYESVHELHNFYINQQDTVSAYKYAIMEFSSKDSLNIEENQTELSQLELQYAFDKKEKQREITRQRKDFLILLIILSLVFTIIIISLIFARNRIKAKAQEIEKKRMAEELEHKNKELTSNVLQLMRKNELITNLSNKLIKIEKEAVKEETKSAIYKIARELKKASDEELIEEFEKRFNQVHKDFYEKLMKRYPSLTPQEQRLCAFLRLNMSSKEISNLTGQRVRSLEIARSRLRKKLGIANSEVNLITFLTKI